MGIGHNKHLKETIYQKDFSWLLPKNIQIILKPKNCQINFQGLKNKCKCFICSFFCLLIYLKTFHQFNEHFYC